MARSTGGGSRGGGSHGGGGRSMGGGSRSGSRSFSGSGRSGIGSSGGHRNIGGGGSFGGNSFGGPNRGPRPNGPHPGGPGFGGPGYGGPGYPPPPPPRPYYGRRYGRSSGCGCSGLLSMLILFMLVGIVFSAMSMNGFGSNKKLNRDKFNGAVDSSHGYYIDNSEGNEPFIDGSNDSTLNSGFKEFYSKTGVFPFLYVIEHTPDPSEYNGYATYQDKLYEDLFDAEGNLLILYIASEDDYYFAAGYDTGEIIDEESLNVICDKVNSYWSSGDLAVAFGKGLRDASKNIMAKSNARVIMIALIIGVVVVIIVKILYKWWQARTAQKNKEQEDLERTLNTPLETFGSTPMDDLKKKYDDTDNS